MADQEEEPLHAKNMDTPAEEDKLHAECRKLGKSSAVSLTKISNDPHNPYYAIEINRLLGNAWDQQKIIVGWKGLLAIHRLIEPLIGELKNFEHWEEVDSKPPGST